MGFTVNFTDNQNVSAEALNEVSQSIDSDAALDAAFADDTLYGVDALNAISAALISKGVSYGCSVSCSGADVTISAGTAFFDDGKKMTIDADGISLTRTEGVLNYVWLSNDSASGTVSAKCTQEEPSGDYVSFAVISKSGIAEDKKDIALMKNASILPNCYKEITIGVKGNSAETEYTEDLGGNFRRMVVLTDEGVYYYDWDNNKAYKGDGTNQSVENSPADLVIYLKSVFVVIKSLENNVLTYTTKARYESGFSGSIRLICM